MNFLSKIHTNWNSSVQSNPFNSVFLLEINFFVKRLWTNPKFSGKAKFQIKTRVTYEIEKHIMAFDSLIFSFWLTIYMPCPLSLSKRLSKRASSFSLAITELSHYWRNEPDPFRACNATPPSLHYTLFSRLISLSRSPLLSFFENSRNDFFVSRYDGNSPRVASVRVSGSPTTKRGIVKFPRRANDE